MLTGMPVPAPRDLMQPPALASAARCARVPCSMANSALHGAHGVMLRLSIAFEPHKGAGKTSGGTSLMQQRNPPL